MNRGIYEYYSSEHEALYLQHHGILGQKWGVRRYQNPDGTYTNVGKKRLRNEKRANKEELKDIRNELNSLYKRYGELDDMYTYGKNADTSKNAKIDEEYSKINDRINELKSREKELNKGKLAKGLGIAAGVAAAGALAYYGYKKVKNGSDFSLVGENQTSNILKAYANELKYQLKNGNIKENISNKALSFIKENGKKAVNTLNDSSKKAGKAMLDAAMISVGTIAIGKIASKLDTSDNVSESVRNRNQILKDASTAGIQSLTGGSGNSNKNNKNNSKGPSGSDITSLVGEPARKSNPMARQGEEYNSLFKDENGKTYDDDTRSTIKSMIGQGYSAEQVRDYCKANGKLQHSLMYNIRFIL